MNGSGLSTHGFDVEVFGSAETTFLRREPFKPG
jgi:hypothetical protein